jgi:hypothetical protein
MTTISVNISQQPADVFVVLDGGAEQRLPAGHSKSFPFDTSCTITLKSAVQAAAHVAEPATAPAAATEEKQKEDPPK